MNEEEIKQLFASYSNEPAKLTVPATGLFLERIYYGTEKIKHDFQRFMRI
jgi:tRNA U38,U39,U40 pseudouridine synthase TruA